MPNQVAIERPCLLLAGISLPLDPALAAFAWSSAEDGRGVLLKLRATRVDLLLLGVALHDVPFAPLVRRVKAAHPQQKWALVAPEIEPPQEIEARALGALVIFEGPPSATQLREVLEKIRPRGRPLPAISTVWIHHPRPPGRQRAPASPTD